MIRKLDRVRLTRDERVELSDLLQEVADIPRPKTRAECIDGPRPCPWVSCRYHLYLDVDPETGKIKLNTTVEPWEMAESCVLDVAERGSQTRNSDGATLEEVGELLSVTRERIRQIEAKAMRHMRLAVARKGLSRELHGSVEGDKHRPDLNDASQSVENAEGVNSTDFAKKVSAWQPENRKKLSHWTRSKKGKVVAADIPRSPVVIAIAQEAYTQIVKGDTMSKKSEKPPKTEKPAPKKHTVPAAALEHAQKLRAMGWTWGAISQRIDYSETGLVNIISGHRPMKPETEAALLALPLEAPETPLPSRRSSPNNTVRPPKKQEPEPVSVPKPLKISCASCDDKEGVVCDEPLCVRFRAKPQYLTIPAATAQAAKEILAIPRTPLEHIDAKILEAEMRLRILRELRAELQ